MVTLSNPRRKDTIHNWPSGAKMVRCDLWIETKNGKERLYRSTETRPGRMSNPRHLAWRDQYVIADGSDGKIYFLYRIAEHNEIVIVKSNMNQIVAHVRDCSDRYDELLKLFSCDDSSVLAQMPIC